jgi:hypothetical protein
VDIGWLVSALAASATYLLVSLRFNPADEQPTSVTSVRASGERAVEPS